MSEQLDRLVEDLVAEAIANACDCPAIPVMLFHCLAQDGTDEAAWLPVGGLDDRDPEVDGAVYLMGRGRGWWDRWRVECPDCARVYAEGGDTGPCVT